MPTKQKQIKKTESTQELILLPENKPQADLEFATQSAKVLVDIVKKNNWSVRIQNKDYLQFEAWQTLARFFGYTVKTVSTAFVEYGTVKGFEAKVAVLDKTGLEIGGAESVCMSDEKNWVGKPMYALKSMAQTRASARALRQILAWVVVLAGYSPVPTEEMPRDDKPTEQAPYSLASAGQKILLKKLMDDGKIEKDYAKLNTITFIDAREVIQKSG